MHYHHCGCYHVLMLKLVHCEFHQRTTCIRFSINTSGIMSDSNGKETLFVDFHNEEQGEDRDDEEMAARTAEDKVSIKEILQEMTNEFNRGVNIVRSVENDLLQELDGEEISNSQGILEVRGDDGGRKGENDVNLVKKNLVGNFNAKTEEEAEVTENVKEDQSIEEDAPKKDGNIPRIVLTFRTVDENTVSGKKTKISSCSSNLRLVPDDLVNCNRIGGVSVKIEHSDDYSDQIEKSDTEDNKEDTVKDLKIRNNEEDENNESKKESSREIRSPNSTSFIEESSENKDDEISSLEPTIDEESSLNSQCNKKTRRGRLRNANIIGEGAPSPKRSARRMCKESLKSTTVLESAIARKEKSNYTEEHMQFKPIRKYSKPGRPKKMVQAKETTKQSSTKVSESRYDATNNTIEKNRDSNDFNSIFESSKVSSSTENSSINSLADNSLNSFADFEEMPKLSPVMKTSADFQQTKFNDQMDRSFSEDCSAELDKPFLKPALGKTKRERGRPRSGIGARKIAKSDFSEDRTNLNVETEKNNDHPEESTLSPKRTRRSMVLSPSRAVDLASKLEAIAASNENNGRTILCLCQVRSELYVTVSGDPAPLYCTAMDSIDNQIVGCCNEIDSDDVAMRRPSTRVPYIILCHSHKQRLLRHNCCPSCGVFCSQGRFIHCTNGHQYHRECEVFSSKRGVCPHCGSETSGYDVFMSMIGSRKPVFIPTRRKFLKLPPAKMSLPGKGDNTKLAERPPGPLIQPEFIKVPEPNFGNSERPERYTIMSLYTCVRNGDLDKLVNILACGYNANHTFREYSSRTSLHVAAEKGHLSCLHVLIQAGAQVDVMDKNQLTPLMLASMKGQTETVCYLVRVGADVSLKGEDGMTALHMAAKFGHLEVCRIILSECKAPRTLVDSVDDGGWTSLIWACEFKRTEVARFLIEKKCDPLIRDSEQNIALHWSAYSGSSEITEILLNEGCDVNAVNVHGDTPLHIAARQDQYAVSVLLLARGAKINEVNVAGETAISCCSNDGDTLSALRLNAKVNELAEHMWEKTVRILSNDISRGKEINPIQCVNGEDSEDKPTDFVYVTENCFTSNISVDRTITSLQSCRCENNCSTEKCLCGTISLRCWYDEEGRLLPEFNYNDPPMLFECNPACDCHKVTCNNRVVQHGSTQRFQLFRTSSKGWGLRTLRHISKGTYVCEYVGEIISDSEADHREDDSYLFDLDNRDGETYCIDARRYGNIARFINHSCAPNLLPVRVFIEHQDLHFPRISFFAKRDIQADEELGFDYGEKFWIIKCKSFKCACGAEHCRYSEKTIQVTLHNYRKRIQREEMFSS